MRESYTYFTPSLRSVARLKVLAVANTSAPNCWAI
ncbi:Uncharacterised protein [Mycobacteroides abscessus subsp. abscessus]|nr:Uncharacterised protein [Mycobacteroides abscessus subsp. abscessus]SKS24792.1 Uncharacterised protein [Mycobacteroides abscessus subsp. abscessus]SKU97016.1 Uncharacterised protein [Mycobacteroides abscessus subsp. abscessus]